MLLFRISTPRRIKSFIIHQMSQTLPFQKLYRFARTNKIAKYQLNVFNYKSSLWLLHPNFNEGGINFMMLRWSFKIVQSSSFFLLSLAFCLLYKQDQKLEFSCVHVTKPCLFVSCCCLRIFIFPIRKIFSLEVCNNSHFILLFTFFCFHMSCPFENG